MTVACVLLRLFLEIWCVGIRDGPTYRTALLLFALTEFIYKKYRVSSAVSKPSVSSFKRPLRRDLFHSLSKEYSRIKWPPNRQEASLVALVLKDSKATLHEQILPKDNKVQHFSVATWLKTDSVDKSYILSFFWMNYSNIHLGRVF